jgi:hypothetical protein
MFRLAENLCGISIYIQTKNLKFFEWNDNFTEACKCDDLVPVFCSFKIRLSCTYGCWKVC